MPYPQTPGVLSAHECLWPGAEPTYCRSEIGGNAKRDRTQAHRCCSFACHLREDAAGSKKPPIDGGESWAETRRAGMRGNAVGNSLQRH